MFTTQLTLPSTPHEQTQGPGRPAVAYPAPPISYPSSPPRSSGVLYPPPPAAAASPLRRITGVDCTRIGWFGTAIVTRWQDYTSERTSNHTGDMLDEEGRPVGKVMDCTPFQVDPREGLQLSGPTTYGRYTSDDSEENNLGYVRLPEVKTTGVAVSVALRVKLQRSAGERCLFWMGDGWADHFAIWYYRGRFYLECSPGRAADAWNARKSVGKHMELDTGRPIAIVATLGENGRMRLYLDGQLVDEGLGLGEIPGFSAACMGRRKDVFIGRWFRPDQSYPTHAGLYNLDIFDGELDQAAVNRHHAETVNGSQAPAVEYVNPPPALPVQPSAPPAYF